jgi:hypothetical protein
VRRCLLDIHHPPKLKCAHEPHVDNGILKEVYKKQNLNHNPEIFKWPVGGFLVDGGGSLRELRATSQTGDFALSV